MKTYTSSEQNCTCDNENFRKFNVAKYSARQLLFIWVAIYSQIIICMQNILTLIISYYQITTVIIKITDLNIVIWK